MAWMRVDAGLLRNPKIMRMGKDAAIVFLHLLSLNHENGRDGRLTDDESHPAVIAGALACFGIDRDDVAKILDEMEARGMIARDADARIAIAGWDDDWRPKCSTCRKPNPATNSKTCPTCVAKRDGAKGSEIRGKTADGPRMVRTESAETPLSPSQSLCTSTSGTTSTPVVEGGREGVPPLKEGESVAATSAVPARASPADLGRIVDQVAQARRAVG